MKNFGLWIFGMLSTIPLLFYKAFVLTHLIEWFVQPQYPLFDIELSHLVGYLYVISFIMSKKGCPDKDESLKSIIAKGILWSIITSTSVWFFGFTLFLILN